VLGGGSLGDTLAPSPPVPLPVPRPIAVGTGANPNDEIGRAYVKNLQTMLNDRGANLKVDGIFGRLTKGALGAFKHANGIRSWAGMADEDTLAALAGLPKQNRAPGPPTAPLIPPPGQLLDPALAPSKNPADLGNTADQADLRKTLIPLEPVKPLPGGVVPLPGDAAFLQQHPEFAPLSTVERIAKGADILTPVEGGYLTEAERLRGQTGATPLPHPISTPNALVAATVPYGRGVDTIGLVPGGLPQGAPPAPQEAKIETVKPVVQPAQPLTDAERTQVSAYKASLGNDQVLEDEAMIERLGVKDPDTFYKAAMDRDLASGRWRVPASAKAEPASLSPESSAPAKGEPGLFERIQQGFSSDMRKLFGGDEPAAAPATPASPKADRAVPSLTTEQALENRAWFDSSPSPVRTQIRRAVDKNGTDIPTEVERYRQEHGERGGGKQSSLDSRAAGQVASADAGFVPAGSTLDQEIAARGGTPTKPGPMGFEFGKIPQDTGGGKLAMVSEDPARQAAMEAADATPPLTEEELAAQNKGYEPGAAKESDMRALVSLAKVISVNRDRLNQLQPQGSQNVEDRRQRDAAGNLLPDPTLTSVAGVYREIGRDGKPTGNLLSTGKYLPNGSTWAPWASRADALQNGGGVYKDPEGRLRRVDINRAMAL
jgi:hypothetical protein